ncbi:G-protein coupled receptor Mth2 isoform X1 [Microplitis demolitor]|uniref:G-protein coupled receptor Mth2 isoform X1 n=1 Tax=Microplitis demolitor TaxID=69319 RepID=UPI00235B6FF4|nr:G-protein coupled receptor Mth2 isoform X1 [Microplitis demolitor]
MIKLILFIIILSITKLSLTIENNNNSKICPESLSLPLEPFDELIFLPNGSIIHQDIIYPKKYLRIDNNTNNNRNIIYGCVCEKGFSKNPCIRKCCQDNEILKTTIEKSECIKINETNNIKIPDLLPANNQLSNDLKNTSGLSNNFKIIKNMICPYGMYRLEPERYTDDEFIIFSNGSLKTTEIILSQSEYCIDWNENLNNIIVIVCHIPQSEDQEFDNPIKTIVHPIGVMISIPFFAATLFVYAVIPELRNLYGITLMCYVGCIFGAYSFLVASRLIYYGHFLCVLIAFVIHFSFLASFFWLNVMCFDIWWTFGGFRALQGSIKQRERKKFIIYSSYAWGCAGILTGICLIMDFHPSIPSSFIRPQFGEQSCWFTTDAAKAIYFYGPMGMTVICNIILFISTAIKIVNHKKETAHHLKGIDSHRHDDNKQWFNLYLKLFIVMGINWSMEIISWLCKDAPDYVWYVTDIANTLQGLIIFIIFVWKDKIKRLLLKRFGCKDSRFFQSRNSTRSGYHSSMSTRTNTSTLTPLQDKFKSTNSVEKNIADDQTDAF